MPEALSARRLFCGWKTFASKCRTKLSSPNEADFPVNIFEDNISESRVDSIIRKTFKTETSKRLCQLQYKEIDKL